MSIPNSTPPPEGDLTIDLGTVVSAFIAAFPTPTDEQLHKFASILGINYEDFETQVFKMFGEALQDEEIEDMVDDEEVVTDDLDLFLVAFFTFKPDPTEEEVHQLAEMMDVAPEEIEERVYRMLHELSADEDGEDETEVTDEDEDLLADSDEDENGTDDESEEDDSEDDEDLGDEIEDDDEDAGEDGADEEPDDTEDSEDDDLDTEDDDESDPV